ncbi:cation diffusion facilitator family transporter [Peribacillus kribbensis]|uniref:cation diffusion facilitator family transporter n=1 Tax=Peribacillus kribbensis TaxID=356658 RepID=UPI00040D71AB|nr:cation diffusion facilitator family transporter [Peribacillus kribbensis]
MKELFVLLKQGNKSALMAAIVNAVIAILRGTAFIFTGNVAMFAETMHAIGDAANQFFVFIGSALSKKTPTKRFPNGFGRLVNLVLLGAVIVVAIMSFETIKEGIHHVLHPTEAEGFFIVVGVLLAGVILESIVLAKAMKEVIHETHAEAKGLGILVQSFKNVGKATPATKLVFMEDLVATGGGLLALLAVLLSKWTGQHVLEGLASVLIGLMMLFVVGKVFLDNAAGVLGEADDEMENKIGHILIQDPEVKDIRNITVMKEGETLHVEVEVELEASITIEEADVIKERLAGQVMEQKGVADVLIEFSKDDGEVDWKIQST